ncbi:hypothetical protein EOD42_05870 [Rhodovarius crocodyli]|uniref:Uncharacterized protein n=1 Tax=Rhodovarius crocodyli TaxID=1979269 RepID=A0A437MPR3_9PROT|nr:hypothetical protein [Rhodovarius crocodyli]RVT99605.1 hypothetical protein EOD42_05870 [Rhodovarius crocodyli]
MLKSLSLSALITAGLITGAMAQSVKPPSNGGMRAPQQQQRGLTVVNRSDTVLYRLFVFRQGGAEGPDRLGQNVVPSGRSFQLQLGRVQDCRVMVRSVFQDESEETRAVDICAEQQLVLTDEGRRDVQLDNATDATLMQVFLIPRGESDPGPDRLGSSMVAPGEHFRIRLRNFAACDVTVRASFAGLPAETREVNICNQPQVAFGDPSIPLREVPIVNRSSIVLYELYAIPMAEGAAPQQNPNWGPDRLGANVIGAGRDFSMRIRSGECRARVRAVFQNRREEIRDNVNICQPQPVVFQGARRLAIGNLYERPITGMYLSPVEERDWGSNQINEPLRQNGTAELGTDGGCRADLRIVFDNESAEELRNFDMCRNAAITLRPGWVTEARQ